MKNTIEKQKTALIVISVISIVLGVGTFVGAVLLVVFGAKNLGNEKYAAGGIEIGIGAVLVFLAGIITIFGIKYLWVGLALKATKGSVAQGNVAMNGTVNMKKCPNCGAEVQEGDQNCGKCGYSLADKKVCPNCGATNMSTNTHCSACGAELK